MSNEISINYNEVYSTVATLKGDLTARLNRIDGHYSQLLTSARNMDSSSNKSLCEAMEKNKRKAAATAEILEKVLDFIESSTRQVQLQEAMSASRFTSSGRTVL